MEGNPGPQEVPWGLLKVSAPLGLQVPGQGGNPPETEGLREEGHPAKASSRMQPEDKGPQKWATQARAPGPRAGWGGKWWD